MDKVLNKNKLRKIISFIIVVLALIISMIFVFKKDNEYKELPKVKLKEQNKPKQFALMLEQDNGEYQESEGELPTEGYIFNKEKSGCTDINGKIINDVLDYDYENYIVLLDTSKTSYCYLYYDIEPNISYLRSKDTDSHITEELTGGMYRYQGLSTDDVRNYICLGDNCCNTEECNADTNDYMYRIIGINAKGELKVIKKTSLTDGIKWWTDQDTDVEWPKSILFQSLNGNSYYNITNEEVKALIIKDFKWLYGYIYLNGYHTVEVYNGNITYNIETGKVETTYVNKGEDDLGKQETIIWSKSIEAPIGLMYIHDYLYAYPGGNPENGTNASKSWIHLLNNQKKYAGETTSEWTIVNYGYESSEHNNEHYRARDILYNGIVDSARLYSSLDVRPVFYLSNDIELTGEGTLDKPFKIF